MGNGETAGGQFNRLSVDTNNWLTNFDEKRVLSIQAKKKELSECVKAKGT